MDFETYSDRYLKDLKKVKKLGYALDRMLIVDDSVHKLVRQYGNAVYIRAFEGAPDDRELELLLRYLREIRHVANFRALEKRGWRSTVADEQ